MSLSKKGILKRGVALFLALSVPAGTVCATEPEEPQAKITETAESALEEDASGVGMEGEEQEPSPEENKPEKKIRKIEVEKEITKTCGEVFYLDVKLTEQTENEDEIPAEVGDESANEVEGIADEAEKPSDEAGKPSDKPSDEAGKPSDEPSDTLDKAVEQTDEAGKPSDEDQKPADEAAGGDEETDAFAGESAESKEDKEALEYESDNPEVAAVCEDESGRIQIKALAAGEAVIKITAPETEEYAKAEALVLVHVAAPEPESGAGLTEDTPLMTMSTLPASNLTTVENIAGGISLRWEIVEGAKGYCLEKSTTGRAPWNNIKTTSGSGAVTYIDRQVEEGGAYYYRVRAIDSSGENGLTGASKKITYLAAPVFNVGFSSAGPELKWNRVAGSKGYYVYRMEPSKGSWTEAAKITQPGEISWRDTAAGNGITYYYTVRAYNGSSLSPYTGGKSYVKVDAPSIKSFKRKSSTKFKLTWKTNPSATGYQIQYAQNGMFVGAKKATVKNAKTGSYTLSKLAKKKNYYARIRAYKKSGGATYYSAWSATSNVKKTRTAKASLLTKKKKVFEIRKWAKQKMYQYDTLQGSCTDGKYAYYLMYNRKVVKCKIVKVKRSNLKVVKVSGVLDVAHGNDMTYDSDRKRLVVVHSTGVDPKRLTSVDPQSLQVIESKHVQIPKKLAGGSIEDAAGATAFSGVAYSSGRKQYAVLLSHNYNFVILDSNLEPVRYAKVGKKYNYIVQGIDATDDYIMVAQSPKTSKQKYNIITVYDWDGRYISKINVKKGYEIESIYHVGSKYYAGFYRSYYKTGYKNVVKEVKVKGKVKKKKVKVKYRKYQRDNYVYQIKGI